MKRLKLAKKTIEVSSIGICFSFYNLIIEWLKKSGLVESQSLVLIVCIILIIIIYLLVQFILELIIEVPAVRKKILGQDYIEGLWIEYFYKREERNKKHFDRVIGYSIVTIKRYDEALSIKGRNYEFGDKVRHLGDFSSESLKYLGQDLHYSYNYNDNSTDPTRGVAIMSFTSNGDQEPTMYTGFFINFDGERKNNFMGWKVVDRDDEKKISDSHGLERHKFIMNFITSRI